MLGVKPSLQDIIEALREEYGPINKKDLKEMLELLETEGIIKLK